MKSVATIDEFLLAPKRRYFAGQRYLVWASSPSFAGTTVWGVPDHSDVDALVRLWELFRFVGQPFSVVTDARHFERMSPDILNALLGYMRSRVDAFAIHLERHAVIVPSSAAGAAVAGAFALAGMKHEWKVFEEARAAFVWAGRRAGAATFDEVEKLVNAHAFGDHLLVTLREYLDTEAAPSLERFAALAGYSTRSLQRTLAARGTSFRAEVERARTQRPR